MRNLIVLLCAAVFAIGLQVSTVEAAPPRVEPSESLSPYFFVQGDPKVDHFPLLETRTRSNIAGTIAEIELTQVYKNDGKRTIEAIYVFPLGTKSAIHAMRMKIGKRIIEADIEETLRAQKIYQRARDEGKVASLLEQKRPNVFQMSVANIMPGDVVEVAVSYTETLIPEMGIYEWVFPTVVGPRFTGEKDEAALKGRDKWLASPYLHEGEEPPYKFDMEVGLRTGIPLSKVWVASHDVEIIRKGQDDARIVLSPREKKGGNRDFIVRYTLQGKRIESGLLLYPGKDENFFLLMLEPPKRVNLRMVPPREYLFIVDVSGSMNGFPIEVSKALIRKIVKDLREKDYFNIIFFAGGSNVLSPHPLPATDENKKRAIDMVSMQRGGGGTRILDALQRAMSLQKKEGLSRTIVIATDGYVAVEKEVFDLMRAKLGQANFFAFGIGSSVNRYLIEGMARVGRGEPFVVTNEQEAEETADKFMHYIEHPLLTDIDVEFDGFDAYEVEPPSLPDLFAQRPLILFGKYKNASGTIRVRGKTVARDYGKKIKVTASMEDTGNEALRYLWARESIARLADYASVGVEVKEEVTALGLKYHLMTEYTSFVAVDKVVRETGEVVTVKQPLPLPQGVSDYAVGARRYAAGAPAPKSIKPLLSREMNAVEIPAVRAAPPQVCVTGGTVPQGASLAAVEKVILSQVEKELEDAFRRWELKSLTVVLEVHKGSVTAVKVEKHEAKKFDKSTLEKILKKVRFSSSLQGTLELNLEFI